MNLSRHLGVSLSLVSALVAVAPASLAAGPTKAECLGASEAWIKSHKANHLRDARTQLLQCASATCPADVRNECARHVPEVSAAIPSIVFAVKDASGADLSVVTVTMDGQPFATRIDGTAIELDPGEHVFHFAAAGQPPLDRTFVVREGERDRRETVVVGTPLVAQPPPPPPPSPAPLDTGAPAGAQTAGAEGSGGLGGGRIAAITVTGVGIVGIAVGSVFGVTASSKWSQAKSDCGSGCSGNAPAQNEKSDAQSAANVSTVAFVAGGAAVVVGAVLWFALPGPASRSGSLRFTPQIGADRAGAALSGSF